MEVAYLTEKERSLRYDWISRMKAVGIPMRISLKMRPGCQTVSKALAMSRKTAPVCLLLPSPFEMYSVTRRSWWVVEWDLRKPNCSGIRISLSVRNVSMRRKKICSTSLERDAKSEMGR